MILKVCSETPDSAPVLLILSKRLVEDCLRELMGVAPRGDSEGEVKGRGGSGGSLLAETGVEGTTLGLPKLGQSMSGSFPDLDSISEGLAQSERKEEKHVTRNWSNLELSHLELELLDPGRS
uniref:Uncharacterized protein n=1 Tax=Amphimedon queenslandica TaxID=400682 RepID=A0A1X7T5M1_AMPQE